MTIYIVAAMDGHMEKMWVINSSLKPRAFKEINKDLQRLPTCTEWRASIHKGVDEFDNLRRMVIGFQLQDGYVKEKYRCIPG